MSRHFLELIELHSIQLFFWHTSTTYNSYSKIECMRVKESELRKEEQGSAQENSSERGLHKLNGKTFNFANVIKNTFCVASKKKDKLV